jgi:hypothetical protein
MALAGLFVVVFFLNVIPAFAPPTWLVFSYIGLQFPRTSAIEMAIVGALAATLGRLTLALSSRHIVRRKFLSEASRQNVDAIRRGLEGRRKLTVGALLLYAFSPFPSNYLFIAYGLTSLDLRLIAVPFFLGRSVSYGFWKVTSSAVSRRIGFESGDGWPYFGIYFVASQIALLSLVYLFTKIDWRVLLSDGKLRWLTGPPPSSHLPTDQA